MLRYGTDKPDLRNPHVIADVSAVFATTQFRAFRRIIEKGGVVRAIPAPGAAPRPRSSFQDKMDAWAKAEMGAPGLGYITLETGASGLQTVDFPPGPLIGRGPIANNLKPDEVAKIAELAGVGAGDVVFFAAGPRAEAEKLAGAARTRIGLELGLIEESADRPDAHLDDERRRYYRITPYGRKVAQAEAARMRDLVQLAAARLGAFKHA